MEGVRVGGEAFFGEWVHAEVEMLVSGHRLLLSNSRLSGWVEWMIGGSP